MTNLTLVFGACSPAAVAALRNAFCSTMPKDSWKINFIHGPDPRSFRKPLQLAYIMYEPIPGKERMGYPGHYLAQFSAPQTVISGTRESTRVEFRQWLESNQGVSFVAINVDGIDLDFSTEVYTDLSAIVMRRSLALDFQSYDQGLAAVEDFRQRGAQLVAVVSRLCQKSGQKPTWKFEVELDVPIGVKI